jgi:hypothetical protein
VKIHKVCFAQFVWQNGSDEAKCGSGEGPANPNAAAPGRGKDVVVDGLFFRVDGADIESGEETFLVLRAESEEQAEAMARQQGLLIAGVRPATAEDRAAMQDTGSKPNFYSIFSDNQPVTAPTIAAPAVKAGEEQTVPPTARRVSFDDGKAPVPAPAARLAEPAGMRAAEPPAPPAPAVSKVSSALRPPAATSSRRIPPPPIARPAAGQPGRESATEAIQQPKFVSETPPPAKLRPAVVPVPADGEDLTEVPVNTTAPSPSPRATSLIAGAVLFGKSTTEEPPVAPPTAEVRPALLPPQSAAPAAAAPSGVAESMVQASPAAPAAAPSPAMVAVAEAPVSSVSPPQVTSRNTPSAGWIATVILSPLGFLSVAGGIAYLVYSLNRADPPDASDLQRLDAHVLMLTQCLLGAVLLVGGLLLFVAAGLVYVGAGMGNAKRK